MSQSVSIDRYNGIKLLLTKADEKIARYKQRIEELNAIIEIYESQSDFKLSETTRLDAR